ncbi:carbohydrate kinase family protein [Deinococcus sp. YIM 134068]|uniref:carbohydrate kinase family protein n=1 Tax=Deinococcus lichenicola TaxID=3118910 RepID=UPI002F95E35A
MTAHPFEVVVVGNAGLDTCVYVEGEELDLTREGHFTRNRDGVGQAGGYASRGYARLGHRTAFLGAVGEDAAGAQVRAVLEREGVDVGATFPDPQGTARSVNFVFPDGRRRNFYDGRGHMTLTPDPAACRRVLAGARLAHFNLPNWARLVLPVAREEGVAIACDVQDVSDPLDPYRRDFVEAADYLFFSAAHQPDPELLMRAYWTLNPRLVMVAGMGQRGCALGVNGELRVFPPPPLPWPVLDTNGAGDALAVGFLSGHVFGGLSLEEAVWRGQIAARHTCAQRVPKEDLITAGRLGEVAASLNACQTAP